MNAKFTLTFFLLALAFAGRAQNQIITPAGKPLVIGHQGGVKFSHLDATTPTQASNGKVLSVDDNGVIMLVPESTGTSSQWTSTGTNPDLYFNSGNVGLGTTTPLQRLDVNGDINIPTTNAIRMGNVPFLRAPGTDNLFLGPNAGAANTTGLRNLFIGSEVGVANTTGFDNLFLGASRSGRDNTEGYENVFFGNSAGVYNTTGYRSTFIGRGAGFYNTTGKENTFVGWSAGVFNTTGFKNVFLGFSTGAGVTTGSSNTLLGSNASSNVNSTSNSTAVGESSKVDCDYCLVLGRTSPQVKVGIGTTTPQTTLHVVAGGTTATGVRFENLASTDGTGAYRLYVDASGNVLRLSTSGARESSQEGYWSLTANGHLLNGNTGGVVIGTMPSSTPPGYRLYVSEGILTERVKVAVKNTAEWRDNVLQDGYELRPLEEVASYIRQNRHLPGVPSAQEMVANGNDLHRTDALLLEKVEELTLYVIKLEKENQGMKEAAKADRNEYEKTLHSLLERVEALEKK
ncbi:hypothetical protein [Salmonirosea aquatica]|uniref:TMF family protein n=1 Tax=Salmonirosea aquatica TaxID=2654236 RepID=A0A7C9B7J8_9BACT|nr:hypothetical protein [Cytophagaceae bacterium SJW1-29]